MKFWLASSSLLLALIGVGGSARANGRYPIANQLVVSPASATELTLRTTFGLVLSKDSGQSFSWVCEKAAGFVNNEDPPVEVTGDGTILVASSQALSLSHDGGCVWEQTLADLSIVDADVDSSQPSRAVAIASLYANGTTSSGLEETLDNGRTWAPLGVSFAGLPATVALSPSSPSTIYASGTSTTDLTPLVSRSDDDGQTWHSYPVNVSNVTVPFLAAVDPKQPGVVYVRAPTSTGSDVLVVSTDFGAHWQSIFEAKGGLYGFALSPDGKQIAVGGPNDVLQVASSADYQFKAIGTLEPLCLKWSAAGLYACADEANFGFSLGLSRDSGAHFSALFHKSELELLACPSTTPTGRYCPQAWVGEQALLGIDAGVSPSSDAGVEPLDASAGGSGGIADAGASHAGTSADAAPESDAAITPATGGASHATSHGCSLGAGRSPHHSSRVWLVVPALFAWRRVRPRARRSA